MARAMRIVRLLGLILLAIITFPLACLGGFRGINSWGDALFGSR